MQPVVSDPRTAADTLAACVDSPDRFRLALVDVEAVGGHNTAREIGQQLSTDLRLAGRLGLVMATCQTSAQLEAKAKWAGFGQVRGWNEFRGLDIHLSFVRSKYQVLRFKQRLMSAESIVCACWQGSEV